MKICKSCCSEKGLECFNKAPRNKDGLHSYCKGCMKARYSGRDRSAYKKDYDQQNRERIREYRKSYREKNRGDLWEDRNKAASYAIKRGWAKANPEKVREISANYRRKNKHRAAEYASQRRFVARQAEPAWLTDEDKVRMQQFWQLRELKSFVTGVDYEVDHVVPLNGQTVCGLHVPWNLRLIPKSENRSKSNRVWPNMWEAAA